MLNKIDSFFKFEIFFFCVWAVLGVVKNQEQTIYHRSASL